MGRSLIPSGFATFNEAIRLYVHLFKKLLLNPSDPEVMVLSGLLHKDGQS